MEASCCNAGSAGLSDLRNDVLGQDLAEFNTPLVKRVNLPDGPLGKYRVLVERDQLAQRLRRQPFRQNYIRRTVALKHAMGNQPLRRSLGP